MQGDFRQDLLDNCMERVALNESLMQAHTPTETLDPDLQEEGNSYQDQVFEFQPAESVEPEERKKKIRTAFRKYQTP
jgi:hypothetical protein